MVAYEFYWRDPIKGFELIGILPERRKVPKRITQKSILRWGRMLLYDTADRRSFYFERVTINEYTGKLFRFGPSLKTGIKIKVHCKK
jgi:hypothetical protein